MSAESGDNEAEAAAPKQAARLTTGSIRGHLVSQTTPMIAGIAALMSVGIIDAYFIGQLGSDELAAVSFIFPVTQALSSLGVGVMAGIASVVSRALGRGEDDFAKGLANLGFLVAAGVGIVIAASLYVLRIPLFELMQAEARLLPLIDAYMAPYALGFVLLPAMMGVNGALRAQGAAKRSMIILLTMAVTNWILDPILITGAFGFEGFGVAGAAYATIGGWLVSAVVGLWLLSTTDITIDPAAMRQCSMTRDTAAIARVAGPAAFSNSINPVGLSILTAFLAGAGAAAVAGFGAGGRLQSFAVVPLLGLSSSIGAIVGQNWGADRIDRARAALYWAGGFSIVYGLAIAAIMVLFRAELAALFTDDVAVKQAMGDYLVISAWGYAGFGVFIIANGALNAVDKASVALGQSIARVLVFMVPVALVLQPSWGANAIYSAELSANILGAALAAISLLWVFRERRT